MVDDSGSADEILDRLASRAKEKSAARVELAAYLERVLYVQNPDPDARKWLERQLSEKATPETIANMAYYDPNPEHRRAAGLLLVQRACGEKNPRVRRETLEGIRENIRIHPDARRGAGRILLEEGEREAAKMGDGRNTLTGMPAWKPPTSPAREARGLPPSPEDMKRKITLRGPPK